MKYLFTKDEFTTTRITVLVTCVITALLFVTGCSKPTHVATCEIDAGSIHESIKLNAQEDELTMTVSSVTVIYEKFGLEKEEDKLLLQENLRNQFKGIRGITIDNMVSSETELSYTLTVDYTIVDYETLIQFGLVQPVEGDMPEYVSFQTSIENMSANGYSCK